MCITIPAQIIAVEAKTATVLLQGNMHQVYLATEAQPGDWVLLYAGIALKKIDRNEAELGIALLTKTQEKV